MKKFKRIEKTIYHPYYICNIYISISNYIRYMYLKCYEFKGTNEEVQILYFKIKTNKKIKIKCSCRKMGKNKIIKKEEM